MFEKLVESTKQKKNTRTSRLLLATTLVYASVLTAVGVATVFWFNPALADTMSVAAMLAPPPPPVPKTAVEKVVVNNSKAVPASNVVPAIPDKIADAKMVPPMPVRHDVRVGVSGAVGMPTGVVGVPQSSRTDEAGSEPPPAPKPKAVATPTPEPVKVEKTPVKVSIGVLQGKAIKKISPTYTAIARSAHAQGPVQVQVTISEDGRVIEAYAISGHPLLREISVQAARQWVFSPTLLSNEPVKVQGILTFNFTLN